MPKCWNAKSIFWQSQHAAWPCFGGVMTVVGDMYGFLAMLVIGVVLLLIIQRDDDKEDD